MSLARIQGLAPGTSQDLGLPESGDTERNPNTNVQDSTRAARACEICHYREINCDISDRGTPCTNCAALSVDCRDRAGDKVELFPDSQDSMQGLQTSFDALHAANVSNIRAETEAMKLTRERGSPAVAPALSSTPIAARTSLKQNPNVDELELSFLQQRGAFLLPPRELCDEIVAAYFKWVAPIVPCINEAEFRRGYTQNDGTTSVLLLQTILLAGSKICTSRELCDENGATHQASSIFYRRAKALYDAQYEVDVKIVVQALTLMSWSEEGPEDVTKNVFYWSSLAIAVAQQAGLHRSVTNTTVSLNEEERRARKRIWWTLFARDRSIARSVGRPVQINIDEISLEMIKEEDFYDVGSGPSASGPDQATIQFFLAYTSLSHISGLILSEPYIAKIRPDKAYGYPYLEARLTEWHDKCPEGLIWNSDAHSFLPALLQANYWTTVCLLQRRQDDAGRNVPPGTFSLNESGVIAKDAAVNIAVILDALHKAGELRRVPSFTIYIVFTAFVVLAPDSRSTDTQKADRAKQFVHVCMTAMKDMSVAWLTARMVHSFMSTMYQEA